MKSRLCLWSTPLLVALGIVTVYGVPWSSIMGRQEDGRLIDAATLKPVDAIHAYCAGCHSSGRAIIDLDGPVDRGIIRREHVAWEHVLKKLQHGEMPPPRFPQPSDDQRDIMIHWLEEQLASLEPAEAGRFRVRRVRQIEYRNTVRDLLGVAWEAPKDFPPDEGGWDVVHEVPGVPGTLLEQYQAAADSILGKLNTDPWTMALPADAKSETERFHTVLISWARRAYREPLSAEEGKELSTACAVADLSFEAQIKAGLKIILTSPHFLFRVEPRASAQECSHEEVPNEEAVLASRLSHGLWSSAPDEELLKLVESHSLKPNLVEQTRRMLKDPRARALVEDFASAWLGLHELSQHGIDSVLLQAMRCETEKFFEHIIREDRSVLEFLDADYTFVNEVLARHYGIADVTGEAMRRISLKGTPRGGLLTQASILTLSADGNESSTVQRGKWILVNLLGTPPPAPPAGLLEAFGKTRQSFPSGTTKEFLERHRSETSCAHCHAKIDGLGLPLENFDAAGAWRSKMLGRPIDPTGIMSDGQAVVGPVQLRGYLLGKREMFVRCLAGKLLKHFLGRKLVESDGPALDAIARRVIEQECRFSSVVVEVVRSRPFQRAWGEAEE
jgi:mono/diheme cytochrome c family protein